MAKIVNDWIVRAIAESSDYFDGVDHYKKTAEIILMMRSLGYSAVDTMKVLAIHVPEILEGTSAMNRNCKIKKILQDKGYDTRNSISSTEDFIRKSLEVHAGLYCYEKTEYGGAQVNLTITCYLHGDFYPSPNNHLYGKQQSGCPDGCLRMSYEERIALLSGFLICRTCGVKKKAEGNFPIRSEGKRHRGGGYRRQCRDCLAKQEKERRANLGEEYLKSERERHKRHKEKRNAISRRGHERRKLDKEWHEREKARNRLRAKRFKAQWTAQVAKRRAQRLQATPSWLTKKQEKEILKFYQLAKDRYRDTGTKYHVDHIVPLLGKNVCGLHVPWNLQLLPSTKNLSKSNKLNLEKYLLDNSIDEDDENAYQELEESIQGEFNLNFDD